MGALVRTYVSSRARLGSPPVFFANTLSTGTTPSAAMACSTRGATMKFCSVCDSEAMMMPHCSSPDSGHPMSWMTGHPVAPGGRSAAAPGTAVAPVHMLPFRYLVVVTAQERSSEHRVLSPDRRPNTMHTRSVTCTATHSAGATAAHSPIIDVYMISEMKMAVSVPRGMLWCGLASTSPRLAPDRMPVKLGKKTASMDVKLSPGKNDGPQLPANVE